MTERDLLVWLADVMGQTPQELLAEIRALKVEQVGPNRYRCAGMEWVEISNAHGTVRLLQHELLH